MSGEHRCHPDEPHLPIGGTPADPPGPPREPGPSGQQRRESVTLNGQRPKGGDGKPERELKPPDAWVADIIW